MRSLNQLQLTRRIVHRAFINVRDIRTLSCGTPHLNRSAIASSNASSSVISSVGPSQGQYRNNALIPTKPTFRSNSSFPAEINNDDPNQMWKLWFESHEYQPIWSSHPYRDDTSTNANANSNIIQPLDHAHLDNSSRTLLSQLHDISYGSSLHIPKGINQSTSMSTSMYLDVPTTQQCNAMIERLGEKNERTEGAENETNGRALRAFLIWKKMEYCMDIWENFQFGSNSGISDANTKLYHSLPRPNRETYLSVLTMHTSATDTSGDAPRRALEIVKKMEERFQQGHWDAEPSRMIWNQVLASWANTSHPHKGYEAYNVYKNHMSQDVINNGNGTMIGLDTKEEDSVDVDSDASTFGNIFRACATTDGDPKAKELAGKVAVRMWAEFKQSKLMMLKDTDPNTNTDARIDSNDDANALLFDRGSYMFVYALKAVQLVNNEKLRAETTKSQFDAVCQLGLVNTHVIHALRSTVTSNSSYAFKVLRNYTPKKNASPARIFQNIPKEWKRNCKTNSAGW